MQFTTVRSKEKDYDIYLKSKKLEKDYDIYLKTLSAIWKNCYQFTAI